MKTKANFVLERPGSFGMSLLKNLGPIILIFFSFILWSCASLADTKKNDFQLTILHTNDIHAHDEPYSVKGKTVGGMGRLGHLIRNRRAELKAQGKNYVVVDAGDLFQGSALYSHYNGEVEVYLLNKIGYDLMTLGNHEFDDGASNVVKQFKDCTFDIVNCNLNFDAVKPLKAMVKPSVIKEFNGKKVAFVGAITPAIELISGGLEGIKLKAKGDNWIDPIREEVERLKKQGIDRIILVTHCGFQEDKQIAKSVPDVDVIIGGHSHTTLEEHVVIDHEDGASTTVVQTGCYCRNLGELKLSFDENGVVKKEFSKYKLYPIVKDLASDKDLDSYIAKKMKPILHLRREIVGFVASDFPSKVRRSDSAIGNLVCDSLHEYGKDYGVEITFHNRGGIRGHLYKGPLTAEMIEQILPFNNYAVFAEVKGEVILRVLNQSLDGSIGGKFFDVHGLKIAYDYTKPNGKKLNFVLAKDKQGNWSKLDKNKWYKICVNSYNFDGGEGYDFSGARNVKNTKVRMAQVLKEYVAKTKKVFPQKPNRLVAIKDGILSKINSGKIELSGVSPGASLSIVIGSEPGVSTIYKAFPVPVNRANILERKLKADDSGRFDLPSTSTLVKRAKKFSKKSSSDLWLCVVAFPKRKDKKNRTMISNPIKLQ